MELETRSNQEAAAGRQPPVDLRPLGALSQLQSLTLKGMGKGSLDAGSLCSIAAGCACLKQLQLILLTWDLQASEPPTAVGTSGATAGMAAVGLAAAAAAPAEAGTVTAATAAAAAAGPAAMVTTWPSLEGLVQRIPLEGSADLMHTSFSSMPALGSWSVTLDCRPYGATKCTALHAACSSLADCSCPCPCPIQLMFVAASFLWGSRFLPKLVADLASPSGLGQLAGRVPSLRFERAMICRGDVASLAAVLGHGLQELDLSESEGPCGAVAQEAAEGLHGLTMLRLHQPAPEPGWVGDMLRACTTAQTDPQRSQPLSIEVHGEAWRLQGLKARWDQLWASLPQPQAGPMRVNLAFQECEPRL